MSNVVRVRFAPSPTGGLHLGGVRTVLYNYLFAKKHNGRFILRIEDTDQSRYVPGAEEYIYECLSWCGLLPDESPLLGGSFAPYRQSERKEIYHQYAHWLVDNGFAYYAFDTPEQLEAMRESLKTPENPSPTYNQQTRGQMRNSLSMEVEEARELIADGTPYVVRIKMPENETIGFTDLIRGQVQFNTSQVDDKVLLKADGMPTYHLAVVVDDYLMQITHAFRGEEWLSSAPVHIRLWQCLGWEAHMPQWAHLPLIMGPDGAKLSKRHGNKYGFPIFAMNWNDTNQPTEAASLGFRERGFLPQAFVNLLAMLGWNDGTGQEIFTLEQLIEAFDLSRVHSAGAQFDYEKAKWYNHEWIKRSTAESLLPQVLEILKQAGIEADHNDKLAQAITMVKDRCTLLTDFTEQMGFLYKAPASIDVEAIKPKWQLAKQQFFASYAQALTSLTEWQPNHLEDHFKQLAAASGLKPGELMLPLRIMLVGGKFGPGVFDIAAFIGREAMVNRINHTLQLLSDAG